ncbi:MAG TPA: hypothetical protein VII06_02980 [Chloroflexota bacterium]
MHWRRTLGIGLLVAGSFVGGLVVGAHQPLASALAQGQPSSPIAEYPLSNGVLCYTYSTGNGGFSCVYSPGLSPITPRP